MKNWGKGPLGNWGNASKNAGNNNAQNNQKQGGNNNKNTTNQWGNTTNKNPAAAGTSTGWSGANKTNQKPADTGFQQQQNREPVVTPVCTIDLPISPSIVNLALVKHVDNVSHVDFAVHHISQMEIFNKYTLDEIRYYDYLHGGYIVKIKPEAAKTGFTYGKFGQKTGQTTTGGFGQSAANQKIIQKNISPWRRKPDDLKDPKTVVVPPEQPFGALPATTINVSQAEGDESLSIQETIPDDLGFRDKISQYKHLITTDAPEAATPGLNQLNPQKIQIRTPKEILLKSKPSNFHAFKEKFEDHDEEKNDDQKYSYIPELCSIHDDDVIYNFTVIDHNFGSIVFPDGFKVKQIDPEKSISIHDRKIEVNLSNVDKRNLGIDKNFISIVTLKNVFPNESRKQESLREYETDLMKFCNDRNLGFISYSYKDGVLMFSVPSLSLFPIEIK